LLQARRILTIIFLYIFLFKTFIQIILKYKENNLVREVFGQEFADLRNEYLRVSNNYFKKYFLLTNILK